MRCRPLGQAADGALGQQRIRLLRRTNGTCSQTICTRLTAESRLTTLQKFGRGKCSSTPQCGCLPAHGPQPFMEANLVTAPQFYGRSALGARRGRNLAAAPNEPALPESVPVRRTHLRVRPSRLTSCEREHHPHSPPTPGILQPYSRRLGPHTTGTEREPGQHTLTPTPGILQPYDDPHHTPQAANANTPTPGILRPYS